MRLIKNKTLRKFTTTEKNITDNYNNKIFRENGTGYCQLLKNWINRKDAIVYGYFKERKIIGYGVATVCYEHKENENLKLYYRFSPIYADSVEIATIILRILLHYAIYNKGARVELTTLKQNVFSRELESMDFISDDNDYIVCNRASLIKEDASILNNIYASMPLEYPHEISTSVNITSK